MQGCGREAVTQGATPSRASASWKDRALPAERRAELLVAELTREEKLTLLTGYFGVQTDWNQYQFPEARPQSAGLVRGVPRVGFPPQWQTDAGSGVATQGEAPPELERTLLPSGILTASTWNPALSERAGAMIGDEARRSGFNVMLAGGVNLLRDPGNGRNFEYGGEDPLLAGTMVGALVRGIQSRHVVSTVKHFALNDQETGRRVVDVKVDEAAARMSDLLAFQLAIEQGRPGSVMCSYNLVNGVYACQNEWLLTKVLKGDWGYTGYVMTDWGAQKDTVKDALAGLDQETGVRVEGEYQWLDKLGAAIDAGKVPPSRLDDMVRRIARALLQVGAIDSPVEPAPIDFEAHARVTREVAEEGIVLLQNEGVLPLAATTRRIALVGGHADVGVLTGGGSAQVYARGGNAVRGLGPAHWPGPQVYAPSSPLQALRRALPGADITWSDGTDRRAAASAAARAEVAVVVVTQWTAEALDFPLTLPDEQDQLVADVARANPRTVVVLQTGGPVLMPWLSEVAAVVQAWYPGSEGGDALARVLSGTVNPSGRLPASFPRAPSQLPRPEIAGTGLARDQPFSVTLTEGAAVGYRWYGAKGLDPLFWFGHGLSYTTFAETELTARAEADGLEVSFAVTNTGGRAGKHVAQVYVSPAGGGWEAPRRLGAFKKLELAPDARARAVVQVDPRLLAMFDVGRNAWHVAAGDYRVSLASSAHDAGQSVVVRLGERWLPAGEGARSASTLPAR
jgi:beta-glucosidase